MKTTTQGPRGGNHTPIKTQGWIRVILSDETEVAFDDYKGGGNTYQKREKTLINITTPEISWSGNIDQLAEIIKTGRVK